MQLNKTFLKFICEITSKQRKVILSHITKDQIDLLSEIALNIYKGIFPNRVKYVKHLAPYKSVILRLGSKTEKYRDKKKLLVRYHKIIPNIVKPALEYI